MNFKKINNITGWVVCFIACSVYILTAEAGGSLWDCGEFVSSCFKLQVPHPPGAPMFVLLGRFFIVLFGDNPLTAAKAVNIMNALASGFTILFLFWTITHFARRIVHTDKLKALTGSQIISIMGAGIVGALAYTFSDSFWYSAVEGEVYALSSFFTAIVFWAILKWEHEADNEGSDKWIIFIFFMMGLSIGVHLLNLLTIPAIVMVYYFRKKEYFNYAIIRKYFIWSLIVVGILGFIVAIYAAKKEEGALSEGNMLNYLQEAYGDSIQVFDGTLPVVVLLGVAAAIGLLRLIEGIDKKQKQYYGGMYIFFVLGCVITGAVQVGVIQYSIKAAGKFDIIFTNNFGMPFFTGFIVFFILLGGLIWFLLRYANKKNLSYLRLGLWCFVFMLIGYSTYITTMIRSNADPAVDMYNVDNPNSLVGYLSREQYGDFPLLYGQKFASEQPTRNKEGKTVERVSPTQPVQELKTGTKYQKGANKYIEIGEDKKYVYLPKDKMFLPRVWDGSNDQNHADYYASFLDIPKYQDGSYDRAPNQWDNIRFFAQYQCYFMYFRYFMWNFSGKQNDVQGSFLGNIRDGNWITGIPFIDNMTNGDQSQMPDSLKNNKAHNTMFLLPFILGVIGMVYQFKKRGDDAFVSFLLFFFTGFAIVLYLNQAGYQPRERDYAYVGSFYAFAIWIGIGVLKVKDWLSKLMGSGTAPAVATVICFLAVPALMAQQEWDDHDRSKKELARDLAKDYLESCAPNAILFSFGDNDTYPLWYAQEVEGIRTDVRVINYSLLGIDWYVNQLRNKVNNSDAIDVIFTKDQIEGRKRDYIVYRPKPEFPEDKYYDLLSVMKDYVGSDDPNKMDMSRGEESGLNTFPTKKVAVPVDINSVRSNGTVNAKDSVLPQLQFDIPRSSLMKNDIAVLNVIAANKWKRPIYFTNNSPYQINLGFEKFLRADGLAYRLVPVDNSPVNTDWMFDRVMNKFGYGGAELKGVYFDEENRRHLNTIRDAHADLARDLTNHDRKDDAKKILNKADKMLLQENFPYGMTSRGNQHNRTSLMFLEECYRSGDLALAAKVRASIKSDLDQQIRFYKSLDGSKAENMKQEKESAEAFLKGLEQMEQAYNKKNPALEATKTVGDSVIKP